MGVARTCMVTRRSSTMTSLVRLVIYYRYRFDGGKYMELYAQVCTNGSLVLIRESLVNVLIHKRRLADAEGDNESGSIELGRPRTPYPESPRMITLANMSCIPVYS